MEKKELLITINFIYISMSIKLKTDISDIRNIIKYSVK